MKRFMFKFNTFTKIQEAFKFMNIRSKLRFFSLIILFQILPLNCEKESCDVVPDTFVNLSLNMILFNLAPTQSLILTSNMAGVTSLGYNNNGIIIYCNSENEYFAYDRTCTYDIRESIPVETIDNFMFAECPRCSSRYLLEYSGFPTEQSVSKCPLKQFRTSFNPNTNILYIYN
jgi:hypothetical protein